MTVPAASARTGEEPEATKPAVSSLRSEAARAASRRNGAKSKGPTSPQGKAKAARNAFKHGFRSKRTLPEPLPPWLAEIEQELAMLAGEVGIGRHPQMERVLLNFLLINEIDTLIDGTIDHLLSLAPCDVAAQLQPRKLATLEYYRHGFRRRRDTGIRLLMATGYRQRQTAFRNLEREQKRRGKRVGRKVK
ncbi:hypothetical protein [Croceicoccus sp. YJ47]|uniref:hypothetical protein n=1 Tax=Croceicoccus sp. YJ47 TaxID=2798724 RepID=UPI0019207879|nr:hypothetical protein [Croceicoccus sp. YJ47]QQN74416.1 hypothetical protein JD971_01035 [Croceicoccus sp. YJ47]